MNTFACRIWRMSEERYHLAAAVFVHREWWLIAMLRVLAADGGPTFKPSAMRRWMSSKSSMSGFSSVSAFAYKEITMRR